MRKGKCIVLFSGGLDSILAARILMAQGVDCTGFHSVIPFVPPDVDLKKSRVQKLADHIKLPLHFYRCGREYIDMLKNPDHGYGKNMNPCVDCKIHFLVKAAEYMGETGVDFLATGEVIGQRPMSQLKNTMNRIEKITGLRGRLLRPLSAKLLPETIPEKEGLVNRDLLFDINGRSRKRQMQLARKFNITEYTSPAGGCLFTDPFISKRVKDLLDFQKEIEPVDIYLLTVGRHFRISEKAKLIVAKNETENNILETYGYHADMLLLPSFKGPIGMVKGALSDSDKQLVYSIIARYGKPERTGLLTVLSEGNEMTVTPDFSLIEDTKLGSIRI